MIHQIAKWFETAIVSRSPQRTIALGPHIPQSVMDRLQRIAFKHQMRYVGAHSKFYRERFAECGIDQNRISHPSQMGDFFTYAEEIRQRPATDFLCAKP